MNNFLNLDQTYLIFCKPSKFNPNSYLYSLNNSQDYTLISWDKLRVVLPKILKNIFNLKEVKKIEVLIREYQSFYISIPDKEIIALQLNKNEIEKNNKIDLKNIIEDGYTKIKNENNLTKTFIQDKHKGLTDYFKKFNKIS